MLTIGFRGRSGAWTGVLRDATGRIVAECGHQHPNRDNASTDKTAAIPCIRTIVKAARLPAYRKFCPPAVTDRANQLADAIGTGPVQCYGQTIIAAVT